MVPDLDGQVWGVRPATLSSVDLTAAGLAFPIFDVQEYNAPLNTGTISKKFQCMPNSSVTAWNSTTSNLLSQAAFANPVAFLAPGTCQNAVGSGGSDPVVLLATGGVDWGPPASIIVALDLNSDTLQNAVASGPDPSQMTDSSMEPLPVQTLPVVPTMCQTIDVPTCQQGSPPGTCEGRVFGQPLVVGRLGPLQHQHRPAHRLGEQPRPAER